MSRSRYKIFETEYPYFLTCTVVGWLPVFTRPETVQIVLDSWRFLEDNGRIQLYGYVVLENHLHLIASAENLSKEIGDFKSYTARKIIDFLEERNIETLLRQLQWHKARHKTDRDYQLWQEGSHPQQIQNGDMMRQKLEYIHGNPVARGYVDEAVHWRWSSARNYAGLPGLISVRTDWLLWHSTGTRSVPACGPTRSVGPRTQARISSANACSAPDFNQARHHFSNLRRCCGKRRS